MTARPTLHAENGGLFEVRRILPRPGGAVDLVVVFKARGRKPAFSAYRREIDGLWKALHGAWVDVDEAVAAVPYADRYSPVVYDPLVRFLSKAVSGATVPVGEGPDLPAHIEDEYERERET